MSRIRALGLLLFVGVTGCSEPPEPREAVRIIEVQCERRVGEADCRTIVEFPNGERRPRMGDYGEAGDSLTAQRTENGWWQ